MSVQPSPLQVIERDSMNILGLMLGGVLERNLAVPALAQRASRLRGNLGIVAGKMAITLELGSPVTLRRGLAGPLKATVRGSLDGLMQVALGKGAARALLSGEIGLSGSPLFALGTLPLLRVGEGRREERPR